MSNLQHSISVIYSEKDDLSYQKGGEGWIGSFCKFLSTLLSQTTKEKFNIKLISESTTKDADVSNNVAVIPIITKNFTASLDLVNFLNDYIEARDKKKDFKHNGICRSMVVLKRPYDISAHVKKASEIQPYDFYVIDSRTGVDVEFKNFFGKDVERVFWLKLINLSYDLINLVSASDENQCQSYDKTVYLANVGSDLGMQYDLLKRDLITRGYTILPNSAMPKDGQEMNKMVQKDLMNSRASVHLIGADYGQRIKNLDFSKVDFQQKIASKHASEIFKKNKSAKSEDKQTFSKLVWIAPNAKNISERQKIFIDELKTMEFDLEESKLLEVPFHEFVSSLLLELRRKPKQEIDETNKKSSDKKSIYLIIDKSDLEAGKEIKGLIKKSDFELTVASYTGNLVEVRQKHLENIAQCDASIIYCKKANEQWIRSKFHDLLKAPGLGRKRFQMPKAICIEAKEDIDTSFFTKYNAIILNESKGVASTQLKSFFTQIEKL